MYICKNILSDILFRFKWKMSDRELSFKGRCFSEFQNLSNCNLVIYLNLRIVQHWQQEILWIGVFSETIYLKLWNPLEYCKMKWYQPLTIKLLRGELPWKHCYRGTISLWFWCTPWCLSIVQKTRTYFWKANWPKSDEFFGSYGT